MTLLAGFTNPEKTDKHVKIESDTINPIQEHSINRLDKLHDEMMIGEGIRKMKMADLKQMVRNYNRHQKKSQMKIKGYGKMKKQELRASILEKLKNDMT